MRTSYSWEGIRQVRATLLAARHVPERLCGGGLLGALYQVFDLLTWSGICCTHMATVGIEGLELPPYINSKTL